MDYSKCSKVELIKIAKERGIVVSSSGRLPRAVKQPTIQDYEDALRIADSHPNCRFMQLPGELRNLIYEKLLIFPEDSKGHPQILATCKQIYAEATGFLYEDNMIELRLSPHIARINGRVYDGCRYNGNIVQLSWPSFLLKTHRLSLEFYGMTHLSNAITIRRLNLAIYSLCSYLQNSSHLQYLRVDKTAKLSGTAFAHSGHRFYYPLYMLCHMSNIEARDWPKEQLAQFIRRGETSAYSTPSFAVWRSALSCAETYQKLRSFDFLLAQSSSEISRSVQNLTAPTKRSSCPPIQIFGRVGQWISNTKFIDEEWEQSLTSYIPLIQEQLNELNLAEMERWYQQTVDECNRVIPWKTEALRQLWKAFISEMSRAA